jgi:AAA family ATP:ADP antiporter
MSKLKPTQRGKAGRCYRLLKRVIDVRPAEMQALGWSWLYIFCVLSSYYILRPIRDEMGVAGGVENLQWLFTGTLVGMILVNPPFAALVAKLPRVRFIAIAYRFFIANLLIFILLLNLATAEQHIWVGRLFFIWTSVFNLFVVSVFWALMVDVFDSEQGKRLFGFIAAGATLGGIAGSSITASLAKDVPATYLLLGSVVLLEAAVFSVRRLARLSDALRQRPAAQSGEALIGGNILSGVTHAFKSPYLVNVSVYILLSRSPRHFFISTAEIARQSFAERGARTALPASTLGQYPHLGAQLFLPARPSTIGVGLRWPCAGSEHLGFRYTCHDPTIVVVVVIRCCAAGNFAFARPTANSFHRLAAGRQIQAKSFHRHGNLSDRRSSGCLVLCGSGFSRAGHDRHLHRAFRSRRVAAQ